MTGGDIILSDNRMRRVAKQIKKDVSQIIGTELKDPRISGITSVTGVEMSKDLRYASIYVSIYGDNSERDLTLAVLDKASGFVRSEIGRRIRLRYTPEISFHLDNSIEYGNRIDKIIKTLKEEEQCDDDKQSGKDN